MNNLQGSCRVSQDSRYVKGDYSVEGLKEMNFKVGKAWAIKESLRGRRESSHSESARDFFKKWYAWASHTRGRLIPLTAELVELFKAMPRGCPECGFFNTKAKLLEARFRRLSILPKISGD